MAKVDKKGSIKTGESRNRLSVDYTPTGGFSRQGSRRTSKRQSQVSGDGHVQTPRGERQSRGNLGVEGDGASSEKQPDVEKCRSEPWGGTPREGIHRRSSKGGADSVETPRLPVGGFHMNETAIPATSHRRRTSTSGLHGNTEGLSISVVARVRPRTPKEVQDKECVQTAPDNKTLVLSDGRNQRQFAVDEVFDDRTDQGSQQAVFKRFGYDLVLSSLHGFNICVLAYGHTGSGKTYTMLGDAAVQGSATTSGEIGETVGLLPRFLGEVFTLHEKDAGLEEDTYTYSCEYFEVYNEKVQDLLTPSKDGNRVKVHVHPKHGVSVEGITVSVVKSADEALELLSFGNQMRTVAATTLNARSSRSHAVFTFRWEHQPGGECPVTPGPGVKIRSSTVLFVDLAGREDQAASRNRALIFREMCHINTSLFHLTHLIQKLSEGQVEKGSMTDFRNTKLTLVLSQALIGNSRTAAVCTLSPSQSWFEESVQTLHFAQLVKKIKTKPVVNNKSVSGVVAELEAEINKMQQELHRKDEKSHDMETELEGTLAMLAHYKRSFEDILSQSEDARRLREETVAKLGLHGGVCAPRTPTGELQPFLTKLTDDPCMQGCCNYFLSNGVMCIGGAEESHVVVHGVGVEPHMCEVQYNMEVGGAPLLTVLPAEYGGHDHRVLLNGRRVRHEDGPIPLEHNDSLIFGYAQGFRLVKPTREMMLLVGSPEALALARSSIKKLDLESAVLETADEEGLQFKEAYAFMTQLSTRATEETVKDVLRALHCLCPLIDEANLITKAFFGNNSTIFKLHVLSDVFDFEHDRPALVVCMLQNRSKASQGGQGAMIDGSSRYDRSRADSLVADDERPPSSPTRSPRGRYGIEPDFGTARHPLTTAMGLDAHMCLGRTRSPMLYVWSIEKFLFRLQEFREIYQEGSEAKDGFAGVRKRLAAEVMANPWQETSFSETKILHEGMALQKASPLLAMQFMSYSTGNLWAPDGKSVGDTTRPGTPRQAGGNTTPSNSATTSHYTATPSQCSPSLLSSGSPPQQAPLQATVQTALGGQGPGFMHRPEPLMLPLRSTKPSAAVIRETPVEEEAEGVAEATVGKWKFCDPTMGQAYRHRGGGRDASLRAQERRPFPTVPRLRLGAANLQRSQGAGGAVSSTAEPSSRGFDSPLPSAGASQWARPADSQYGGMPKTAAPSGPTEGSQYSAPNSARYGSQAAAAGLTAASSSHLPFHGASSTPTDAAARQGISPRTDTLGGDDVLRQELQAKTMEIGHLTAERDRLAALLQGLMDRINPLSGKGGGEKFASELASLSQASGTLTSAPRSSPAMGFATSRSDPNMLHSRLVADLRRSQPDVLLSAAAGRGTERFAGRRRRRAEKHGSPSTSIEPDKRASGIAAATVREHIPAPAGTISKAQAVFVWPAAPPSPPLQSRGLSPPQQQMVAGHFAWAAPKVLPPAASPTATAPASPSPGSRSPLQARSMSPPAVLPLQHPASPRATSPVGTRMQQALVASPLSASLTPPTTAAPVQPGWFLASPTRVRQSLPSFASWRPQPMHPPGSINVGAVRSHASPPVAYHMVTGVTAAPATPPRQAAEPPGQEHLSSDDDGVVEAGALAAMECVGRLRSPTAGLPASQHPTPRLKRSDLPVAGAAVAASSLGGALSARGSRRAQPF
eukprot:TRINITY_DN1747_c0_g1_i1.p1 TRINITY_DN1747_c0_g1~~TRINITY_DN1747_c0_g1_i1.p1  ORF type:complete len:1661 (+),score=344.44 TRINITY_DN1747_c0_g1_i1:135-5117(+)